MLDRHAAAFGLCTSMLLVSSTAFGNDVLEFVERPGVKKFSGQLIARPVQLETWMAEHGLNQAQAAARIDSARITLAEYVTVDYEPRVDYYVLEVPAGSDENETANDLMATGNFQYVEPNWTVYPLACSRDRLREAQWHHDADKLNSCAAWEIFTGLPNVSVGLCDTGVLTTHEDLLKNRLEGYNAVDRKWESAGGNINDIFGTFGHGTLTTGCAAANGDNRVGVSGVGWNLGHRMLRVTNDPTTGGSSIATLNHAALTAIQSGDKVANVSYSGVDSATNLATATQIRAMGGLMVWSAGNDGRFLTFGNRDEDDLIVVSGTNSLDLRSGFSPFGPFVDLVAPATGVYTTIRFGGNERYGADSGNSYSCALVSGLAALIWSFNPSFTPEQVEELIKSGCDDLGDAGVDDFFGYGRINSLNSLLLAEVPLHFDYPSGRPETIDPAGGTSMRVEALAHFLTPRPGTGMLHYDDGSGYVAIPMKEVTSNVYDAVFPALDCGTHVDYYVSVDTTNNERITSPSDAPATAYFAASGSLGVTFDANERFESGLPSGWSASGLWQVTDKCSPFTPCDGSLWAYYGLESSCTYDTGEPNSGALISPQYDLPPIPPSGAITLTYCSNLETEKQANFDTAAVFVNGIEVDVPNESNTWETREVDLRNFAGQSISIEFRFDTIDNGQNAFRGWQVDGINLTVIGLDCNSCYADCDQSTGAGVLDVFDFLCFQNNFVTAQPYACECDTSTSPGVCDIFDFLCFQDAFVNGCP